MSLPPGLRHTIAETRLFTDGRSYVILRLPIGEYQEALRLEAQLDSPFVLLVRDKDEVTLVLPQEEWEARSPVLEVLEESPDYRLITFDLPVDLGLVGYLASLSGVVAEAGVSIFSVSAFSRDHIFVLAEDFERAWDALRALIRLCQEEESAETE